MLKLVICFEALPSDTTDTSEKFRLGKLPVHQNMHFIKTQMCLQIPNTDVPQTSLAFIWTI